MARSGDPLPSHHLAASGSTIRSPQAVPLAIGGAVAASTGFGLGVYTTTVGAVTTGELALDVDISRTRTPLVTQIARIVDVVDGPVVAPLALLLVAAMLTWRGRRRSGATLVVLTILGWLATGGAKLLVHRDRPPAGLVHALVLEPRPDSFPSGHVAFVAALFSALVVVRLAAKRPVAWLVMLGVIVTAAVAYTRLYLGVHYLTDVVAAPLMAAGTVAVAAALRRPALLAAARHESGTHTCPAQTPSAVRGP